jgi:hypothetical protein
MHIPLFPFQTIDWSSVPEEIHPGLYGESTWQVLFIGSIRVRKLKYSPGYVADHWCNKGHVLHCLEGEMITELQDGRKMLLSEGMTYLVGDNSEAHRSTTGKGCVLFVVD